MSHQATLVCWHCGKSKTALFTQQPQFAFEVCQMASYVGMVGYMDLGRGRALIFCDPACARAEMTKAGSFRKNPKGVAVSA